MHALAQIAGGWSTALIVGLLAAALVLSVLFVSIRVLTVRLPLRAVFLVTSGFLFVMAVKFIGEGIQEFQERQILPYHEVASGSWLLTFGLNPTLEALLAQSAVVDAVLQREDTLSRLALTWVQSDDGVGSARPILALQVR